MVKSTSVYLGQLHCEVTHSPSQSVIETDAPKDNNGRGERFSPTDLLGAALGSCMLTTMAIVAERDGMNFKSARAEVTKDMQSHPRRVGSLSVKLVLPKMLPEEYRKKLETAAHTCPVHRSLHPEIVIPVEFIYE